MEASGEDAKNSSPIIKRHHERMQGKVAGPLTMSTKRSFILEGRISSHEFDNEVMDCLKTPP